MPREGRVRQTTIYVYSPVPNKFISMVISIFSISIEIKFHRPVLLTASYALAVLGT